METMAVCKPQREASEETTPADTLNLGNWERIYFGIPSHPDRDTSLWSQLTDTVS